MTTFVAAWLSTLQHQALRSKSSRSGFGRISTHFTCRRTKPWLLVNCCATKLYNYGCRLWHLKTAALASNITFHIVNYGLFPKKKSACESSRVSHAILCFLLRYLMTSWASTVFMDSSYITGYFSITSWMLKGEGILSAMPPTISSTICGAGRRENSANVNAFQEIPVGLHNICQTYIPGQRYSYLLTGFASS